MIDQQSRLEVKNVCIQYRGAGGPAIADVSFSLRPGITALLGINGAGKSTLLRSMAGELAPTVGRMSLDDQELWPSRPATANSDIGYAPQDFSLPARTGVLDAVIYIAWLKGIDSRECQSAARSALSSVGLEGREGDRVSSLSGGMVRRLAIAQALVTNPRLLLLDEPTTGLDPEQRVAVRELLRHDRFKDRVTFMSSHIMEDVEQLAQNVIAISRGRLAFSGSLEAFCTLAPGNRRSVEEAFISRVTDRMGA